MKLTAQRKVSVGVLLLAVAAFAVDRCFFTPPSASAKSPALAGPIIPASPKRATTPANSDGEDLRNLSEISTRLETAVTAARLDAAHPRDAFAAPPAWVERSTAKTRPSALSSADQFRAAHHLLAIMSGEHAGWAIVDGKTVGVGQSVAGFRLVAVRERSAVFESGAVQVELTLPR